MVRCTTDAGNAEVVLRPRLPRAQYASTPNKPSAPMMGRKTKGGRVMMSLALMPAAGGALGLRDSVGLSVGDGDGVGESEGVGEAAGVGDGGPSRRKSARGLGGTLAYRWLISGRWPGKGFPTY